MLNKVSILTVNYLFRDTKRADDDYLTAIYGCETLLYTIISTLGLLFIGILFSMSLEAAIIILIFYICQSTGGGHHANTHFKCFATMSIGLILGMIACNNYLVWSDYEIVILIVSSFLLLNFPLLLHHNKAYLQYKEKSFKIRSIITTIALTGLIFISKIFFKNTIYVPALIGLLLSAFSRTYAYLKEHL